MMKKLGRISYHILLKYQPKNRKSVFHSVFLRKMTADSVLPLTSCSFCTKSCNSISQKYQGIRSSKMAEVPIDCDFPVWGLLPKKETGVVSFLNKYPEYDGRGTIIVILDSGVDPAADGLKVTSTGETKVIERFDCSGCGDVDTSTIVTKVVDGCITGITGRKLKIPESWKNPKQEWRVGVLHPFNMYPSKLKERVQEHRKEHLWDIGQKPAFAAANKQLQDFENDVASKNPNLTPEEKTLKEELEARVEMLQAAEKKYIDLGPTYDCVLFHDGEVWRACIDTSECGNLSTGLILGEYSKTHEHAHLTPIDEMTISINVHDEGNTLEVVGMCSTHGTHVAAIAAGYFSEEPEKNGVAPGAKIVSLTIGDGRLGSMETGTALIRACIKVMELSKRMKIDVINMSYGEHAHWSNAGRIGSVISDVVSRYGVSWVVSAGNHGPALCTVGAPPDLAHSLLIGVGAFVSGEMSAAAYSLRKRVSAGAFSWSSRGPAIDGALAVSVCAPGGAVAAVARFTLRNCQLMNGTSMAAPHVAGVVAVLASGLKAKNLPYSPFSMKRMLENSATYLSNVEPWAQGCGLVNVEKAFELLTSYSDAVERDVTFKIQCSPYSGKGILLRTKTDDEPKDVAVNVEPDFLKNHEDVEDKSVIPRQIGFGLRVAISCSADWVHAPQHLDMMNVVRPLSVRIQTAGLPPGPHFTSINAYDVKCVEKGPVFRVPVTVLQCQPLTQTSNLPAIKETDVLFKPGDVKRHFIRVPIEATWGVIKMNTTDSSAPGRFLVHCMQLVPRRSCRDHETQKMLQLAEDSPATMPFQLVGGVVLEVAITKYWASIGDMVIDYTLELHGLKPDFGPRLVVTAGEGSRSVFLTSLRTEDVQPSAQLKHVEPSLRPSESKIMPLTSRDVIPPNRQIYQLINTYNFHIFKPTDVTPILSLLSDMLYESEFESQMWMMYNSCKQLMAIGDAYPSKYSVKLEKGDYVLRLNIRHENKSLLEKLQEVPVILQQRLQQPITLDVYSSRHQAVTGGKKFSTSTLTIGNMLPMFFMAVPADKITRGSSSSSSGGAPLTGTVTFSKDELGRRVDSYSLLYLPDYPRRNNASSNSSSSGSGSGSTGGSSTTPGNKNHDEYMDALKEFFYTWLAKLEGDKLEQVYEKVLEKFPGYMGSHIAYLQALDSPSDPKKLPHANEIPDVTTAWCEQLIAIADKVINAIDQEKLLAYLGMKTDSRSDAIKIKQEQEKQRGFLIEALCRRGTALCRLRSLQAEKLADKLPEKTADKLAEALRDNLNDLLKFTDLTDTKAIHYGVWHCFTMKQWGKAVKLLTKILEDKPSKDVEERLIEAYRQLGWEHLAKISESSLPVKYPSGYRPF